MATSFNKPPLIELIAELRWGLPGLPKGNPLPNMPPPMVSGDNKLDEFFMRFGGAIYADGFQNVERLVPQGFPFMAYQPVCRFRKHDNSTHPALYQVGPGVFTANAIPPYKSWEEFSPVVKRGVEALLATRNDMERDEAFFSVSLRYIDAFGSSLTQGQDVSEFVQKTLGISIILPDALSRQIAPGKNPKPFLQLQLPMNNDMVMTVGIGEGLANGDNAIIMDTSVVSVTPVTPNAESIMSTFNDARSAIHDMFFGITEPIKQLMQPIEAP